MGSGSDTHDIMDVRRYKATYDGGGVIWNNIISISGIIISGCNFRFHGKISKNRTQIEIGNKEEEFTTLCCR